MAAIVGVEPWRFSYRELARMAEQRQRVEWDRTALIAYLLYNKNRGKGDPFIALEKFNPYQEEKPKQRVKPSMEVMDKAFNDNRSMES